MCSEKLTYKSIKFLGQKKCIYLEVKNTLKFSRLISQSVFNKGGPRVGLWPCINLLQNRGNSSYISYCTSKTSGLCNVIFIILSCFHLTKFFREEEFSWLLRLPSKNKVADELLYFKRHTHFLVKLQCSVLSSASLFLEGSQLNSN